MLRKRRGVAMIIAMVFIVIFSAISIGFLSLSSANTQLADNHRTANSALNSAFSGLELMQYWCSRPDVKIPGLTPTSQRYAEFISDLQGVLDDAGVPYQYDAGVLTIGSSDNPVMLDPATGCGFYAQAVSGGVNGIDIQIIGQAKQLMRKINIQFTYGTRPHSVFDFGVATKEPLYLKGGTLTNAKVKTDSDVYIAYFGIEKALQLATNKSEIAGVAKIEDPTANITALDIKGKIGGFSGQEALDNTIDIGVAPTEFPYPDAAHFKQYATGGDYVGGSTLINNVIPAGTGTESKPYKFTGNTTINGVLYIEAPNVIEFGGNVTVNGMIVAEGDWTDNSGTNHLSFTGSLDSFALPADTQYDVMRQEKNTFLMAPGFALSFQGSFSTLNGAIAGNGIEFSGNAGGTVDGSIIDYSCGTLTKPYMTVEGSSDIIFNRSGITEIPAGFIQEIVIHYNPDSYSESI
jgi:hypothetical protein